MPGRETLGQYGFAEAAGAAIHGGDPDLRHPVVLQGDAHLVARPDVGTPGQVLAQRDVPRAQPADAALDDAQVEDLVQRSVRDDLRDAAGALLLGLGVGDNRHIGARGGNRGTGPRRAADR